MGARLSTIKRVSSNNVPGDMLIASEDEDRSIRRIPSIRYLKKRRGSISAESGHTTDSFYKLPVHPKPEATAAQIRAVVKDISFFRGKNRRKKR